MDCIYVPPRVSRLLPDRGRGSRSTSRFFCRRVMIVYDARSSRDPRRSASAAMGDAWVFHPCVPRPTMSGSGIGSDGRVVKRRSNHRVCPANPTRTADTNQQTWSFVPGPPLTAQNHLDQTQEPSTTRIVSRAMTGSLNELRVLWDLELTNSMINYTDKG